MYKVRMNSTLIQKTQKLLAEPWVLPDKVLVYLFTKLTRHVTLSPASFDWTQAIIHCPVDSSDSRFQGTTCDNMFLQWYRKRFKRDEPITIEHLNSGLPKVKKLAKLFSGAKIIEKQNAGVWLRCMKWEFTSYIRFIMGVLYKLFLLSRDNFPPYHAYLLVWRKE